MARFVIDAASAVRIVETGLQIGAEHAILAPTLLRSQVLERLYQRVLRGEMAEAEALALNADFATRKWRYLGDAVLRRRAWDVARALGLSSTTDAEFIALTELQADALVTDNPDLARIAQPVVRVAPFTALI